MTTPLSPSPNAKIWIIVFLLSLTIMSSWGQDMKHLVKRGETFASIASQYGISENELREANPNYKTCYAGLTLTIKKKETMPKPASTNNKMTNTSITTTKTSTFSSTTGQSTSSKVSSSSSKPHYNATLSLGTAYLRNKKYNKAIKEFNRVLSSPYSTAEDKQEARKYLAQAEDGKEARKEKWRNVLDGVQQTGEKLVKLGMAVEDAKLASQGIPVPLRVDPITSSQVPANNALCYSCQGTKICSTCSGYGKKRVRNPYNGTISYEYCITCRGLRHCIICNGKGFNPEAVYSTNIVSNTPSSFYGTSPNTKSSVPPNATDAKSMTSLGVKYYKQGNYTEAFKWSMKAAQQGVATAQYNVGVCYYFGNGVAENKNEAFKWFMKAAQQGDADAQFNVGVYYDKGEDVVENKNEAFKWLMKAAQQGHAEAQYHVGLRYNNGEGVAENKSEAFKWFMKAAQQGHMKAQRGVACYYILGIGVEANDKEGFKWMMKAAQQGDAEAQLVIATLYYKGVGTQKNKDRALEWCQRAQDNGNKKAIEMRKSIETDGYSLDSLVNSLEKLDGLVRLFFLPFGGIK